MSSKKTIRILSAIGLLIILLVIVVILIAHKENEKICPKGFASVTRIDIKKDNKITVKLVRDSEYWTINDLLPVRKQAINALKNIIDNMIIIGKISDNELFDVRQQLLNSAPEVILWNNAQIINSFFIGGEPLDSSGNYFIPSDDLVVYLVKAKNFNYDLSKYFSPDPDYWREKYFLRHISSKTHYLKLSTPEKKNILISMNKKLKRRLDNILAYKIIDNVGIIDSLNSLYKNKVYSVKIDFLDKDKIPEREFICFGNTHLALFSDTGDNSLALLLTDKDMEIINSIVQQKN